MQKLTHKLMSREKINYRHLTDVLVDSDGNVRFTPGECENPPDVNALLKGFGLQAYKNSLQPQVNGDANSSLDSNISLKSALSDCKRYADRITSAVERACPPPPPVKRVEEEVKVPKCCCL
ncbi:unnamed protein product, partial [Cylicostephanus goldi]